MKKALPLTFATSAVLGALVSACPSPRMPTGPAPEYEEPPRPSWLEAGAPVPTAATASVAPAPAPAPAAPQDAGTD